MNILFKPIDNSNYEECINLSVNENQKNFVAPNMFSLVQAAYESDLYPLGIYNKNKMIGFILYDFDYDINGWSMSRFMIDKKHQNKGFGKVALEKFLEFFEKKHGKRELFTSAEVENTVVIKLYENLGFIRQEVFEYEAGGKTYKEIRMKFSYDNKM